MEITAEKIMQQLSAGTQVAGVIAVFGEEGYYKDKIAAALPRAVFGDAAPEDREITVFERDTDIKEVSAAVNTYPFFSGRSLVIIKDEKLWGGKDGGEKRKQQQEELNAGLEKTKTGLFSKLARAVAGRSTVDADVLDDLEEVLISSDVGVETTVKIIRGIEERVARDKYMGTSELQSILREEVTALMEESHGSEKHFGLDAKEGEPYVVMVVGVNGAGKTTTIGKLAAQLTKAGQKVWIGAADTFRAAAIDQLKVWADRAGATMIRQEMGSDPASVAFDTLTSAKANGADVVLIDTAGRLHNKINLMNELTKIRNVMGKVIPGAPHEVMLVLDGSTGQNAFEQARQFTQATQVTSLTITKLDGTAKGGVVIGISDQFHIPVRYIGIGEGIDQLRIFDRKEFVKALFGDGSGQS